MIAVIPTSLWSHSPFEDSKPLKDYQNFNMNYIIKKQKLLPTTHWVLKIVKINVVVVVVVVVFVVVVVVAAAFRFPDCLEHSERDQLARSPNQQVDALLRKLISIGLLYKLK